MNQFGFFTLLTYIFCVFWRPQEYLGALMGLPIPMILEAVILIFWFMGNKRFDAPQYKYIILLTLGIFVSTQFVLGISLSASSTLAFFVNNTLLFILIANAVNTPERQVAVFKVFVLGTSLLVLHSIDQSMSSDQTGWTGQELLKRTDSGDSTVWQTRYIGIFSDPNDLGMALVCSLPFIYFLLYRSKSFFIRLFWGLIFAGHIYAIYLTNSRGTMLAVAVMAVGWMILRYGGIKFVLPLALAAPLVPMLLPSRFTVTGDQSSQDRIDAWYQGMQMFLSNPIFGVGKDAFLDYHHKTAHNSWVLAFAELGFIGFFAWIGFLFTSLYMVWVFQRQFSETSLSESLSAKYRNEQLLASAVMFSMVGALTCAFFLSRTYIVLLYILPALSVAQYHRFQQDFTSIRIKSMVSLMFLISAGFIALIYVVVRIKT